MVQKSSASGATRAWRRDHGFVAVATGSEVDRIQHGWSRRDRWLLGAAILVTLLAALGVWNPRRYVVIDEAFDHPLVAGMLVVALIVGSLIAHVTERRALRTVLPALVVVVLAVGMLVLGNRIEDERVEGVVDVQGTDLSISIRSYYWWDGGKKPAYLYLHSGDGLLERRIRVGESHHADYEWTVRARLLEPGVVRVEWEPTCCPDRPVDYWTLTLDPEDDLRVTRVESSYGCDEEPEIGCVATP